jgi:hypothetical protein
MDMLKETKPNLRREYEAELKAEIRNVASPNGKENHPRKQRSIF